MPLIVLNFFLIFTKKAGGFFIASCLSFRYHVFADNDTKGAQMNDIINLLGLEDETIKIIDVSVNDGYKTITVEKVLYAHYCPSCGSRMHSRGIKRSSASMKSIPKLSATVNIP